jgi:HSP20 family protein
MSALTPYERMDELMSGVFPECFHRSVMLDWPVSRQPREMKVDVSETDKAYLVKAQVPGAKKEDVRGTIAGNAYGNMARSFSLAHRIDERTLPKRADARGATLKIG